MKKDVSKDRPIKGTKPESFSYLQMRGPLSLRRLRANKTPLTQSFAESCNPDNDGEALDDAKSER